MEGEENGGTIPDRKWKGKRPTEAAARSRLGDWKGDTVAGKWRTGCFMTSVDRKARSLVEEKLDDCRAQTLKESICDSLKVLPCHTLTVDTGEEFEAYEAITAESKAEVYFAHPHSPWERPTSENTNGLLHQFFPKYTSFLTVTQEHLDHAIHRSITARGNVSTGKRLIRPWQKNCCTWFDKPPFIGMTRQAE